MRLLNLSLQDHGAYNSRSYSSLEGFLKDFVILEASAQSSPQEHE